LETYQQVSEDAKSGELYDAIVPFNGNPPRMPKGGILSECEVATIKKWIDNKMPNN
jgi:spermidine/putrescine-binding protein